MTQPNDFDRLARAWMAEGPDVLPDRALDAAFTRIRQAGGRRASAPFGRPTFYMQLAAAAAVIVLVTTGTLALIGGLGDGPGPASSPLPGWSRYTSSRFAYSIEYPADWVVTPATQDWPAAGFPFPDSASVDLFAPSPTETRVFASSVALTPGEGLADRLAQLDQDNAMACQVADRHDISLDGRTARQETFACFGKDYGIEVVVADDQRFYQIDLFSQTAIDDADRAVFDAFLRSFRFGTGG